MDKHDRFPTLIYASTTRSTAPSAYLSILYMYRSRKDHVKKNVMYRIIFIFLMDLLQSIDDKCFSLNLK